MRVMSIWPVWWRSVLSLIITHHTRFPWFKNHFQSSTWWSLLSPYSSCICCTLLGWWGWTLSILWIEQ
jgi:hypothetical protein